MLECPGCTRHFGSLEQLRKHLHGCQEGMRAPTASEILGGPARKTLKRSMTMPSSIGLVCCYCGRNFGSASLRIHQQQCIRDLEHRNALLPKSLRRSTHPEAPECLNCNMEEHNQQALQLYREHVMLKCPGCDRRFAEISQLKKHLGGCPPSRASDTYVEIMLGEREATVRRSMMSPRPESESLGFTCCFCGMDFGSQSLRIHQRSCHQKWLRQDATLPRGLRRHSLPEPPELDVAKKQEHNAKAREVYIRQSMLPCASCDRRFSTPDALRKHMVGCGGASTPSGRRNFGGMCSPCHVSGAGAPDADALESPMKERQSLGFTCCICGQDYGSKSLAIHQRQCRERWSRENAELPKDLQRKGPPEQPELDPSQKEEHNAKALALYREKVMLACRTCDRRFGNYELLRQHESSCGHEAQLSQQVFKRAFTAPHLKASAGTNASPRQQTTPRGPRASLSRCRTATEASPRASLLGLSPRNLFRVPCRPGSPSSGIADNIPTSEESPLEPVLSYTSRLRLATR